jgi:hypothetical protein
MLYCCPQELATSSNPASVEAGLLIIANLASYSTDHMRPHLAGLQPLLGNCLTHATIDVQVRCIGSSNNSSCCARVSVEL